MKVRVARQMPFAPGAILVFDRGYTDYQWFTNLTQQAVYFVTRLKENADYGVLGKFEVNYASRFCNGTRGRCVKQERSHDQCPASRHGAGHRLFLTPRSDSLS